jgi:acetyl-CoA carboxylase biotin carboxyl carrier protein
MWQDKLKEIIYILENSEVNEIEATFWGRRFRVVKSDSVKVSSPSTPAVTTSTAPPSKPEPSAEAVQPSSGENILAPMPGTFYSATSPDTDPFVKEGDSVSEGDTLCIIEAMKIMNEIEAEQNGTITKILVENGKPVEYNQPLFVINPS